MYMGEQRKGKGSSEQHAHKQARQGQRPKGNTQNRKRSSQQRRKRRSKRVDAISLTILIVAVCVFVFALYKLIMMLVPYYFGGQEYDKVKALAITTTDEGSEEEKFQVDFDALLKENPDTVAWLRLEEPAVISYPVVKSKDNNEYLTKTFSANDNKLGAIFMDMNGNSSFTDRNTLIYGHNLKVGGEMFSQLNEYASEDFCRKHPYFYIYTPDGKERTYQVFMAGVVKDTADNYQTTFRTEADYLEYLKMCRNSSNYTVDVDLDVQSKIVSLSTCTNIREDERFLVQGVLIEEK